MAAKPTFIMISGFYWQETAGLAIGFVPVEGAVALVREGIAPFIFAGTFFSPDGANFAGEMFDSHGHAYLYDIELTGSAVRFCKLYDKYRGNRLHDVVYDLAKQNDGSWAGTYSLPRIGVEGPARCWLQSADHATVMADGKRLHEKWRKTCSQITRRKGGTGA